MIYLTFLAAFLLSGIAAYYSVIGLASIFTGSFWPVIIMGGSLEFAKLVTASWLYRNWKTSPFLLKTYLTTAVVVLMLITSMGIFGFLAKAHIDSTLNAGANSVEVKTLNAEEKITRDRLDYLLARAKDPSTASNRLDRQIQEAQKQLSDISQKKLPLLREENKLSADVGPIKYVADIFFGDSENALDKAVRLVIFMIMLVFDPLAVLLLVAANVPLAEKKTEQETIAVEKQNVTTISENVIPDSDNIVRKYQGNGIYTEEHLDKSKHIHTEYDYSSEFSFKRKLNDVLNKFKGK